MSKILTSDEVGVIAERKEMLLRTSKDKRAMRLAQLAETTP